MLSLKPFTAQAMAEIRPLLELQQFRTCDCSVGGLYMWRDYFRQLYSVEDRMLICSAEYLNYGTCFSLPVGTGDVTTAVLKISSH